MKKPLWRRTRGAKVGGNDVQNLRGARRAAETRRDDSAEAIVRPGRFPWRFMRSKEAGPAPLSNGEWASAGKRDELCGLRASVHEATHDSRGMCRVGESARGRVLRIAKLNISASWVRSVLP